MRALPISALAGLLCSSMYPATLTIQVADPTGGGVPRAAVTLSQRNTAEPRRAIADPTGLCVFSGIADAEYLVQIEAPGFGRTQIETVDLRGDQKIQVKLELERVATQIQVTAAGLAQTTDEESKAVDIIDASQIESRGEQLIVEALRAAPGVRVQQMGGPGSFSRVIIRGMRAADTSVLIDGFRLRDAASPQGDASAFLGDLLVGDTNRIEILRGSGSSLYGSNATGGVVNVITESGGGDFHGEAGVDGGGLGLFRGTLRGGGGLLENRLQYSGAFNHLNVTEGIDGNDRVRNSVAHGSMRWQAGTRTSIFGRLLASNAFAQLNDSPRALRTGSAIIDAEPGVTFTPSQDDPDSRRASQQFSGLVALTHAITPRGSLRLSYQALDTSRDNREGPGGTFFEPAFNGSDLYDGRIDTLQLRSDWWLARSHVLTVGYEWEREQFINNAFDQNPSPLERTDFNVDAQERSHAVYVQDQLRLFSDRLLISLSGRMQSFDLREPTFNKPGSLYSGVRIQDPPRAWTGDASAAYFIKQTGSKIRAHVGNSYRAPGLYERFGASFFFGSFSAYGDPNLAPERVVSADFGIDQYLAGSSMRVSATAFYTRLQEVISFDFSGFINPVTDPFGRFGGYRNTGGGLARGVELSLQAAPSSSTTLTAAYTFSNSDEKVSIFTGGWLGSPRISTHMFTGTATQRFGKRFDASFDLFATSNYLYPLSGTAFRFPGPVKADLAASYTLPVNDSTSVRFFTRAENITDRTYFEEGFRTPGVWAVFGMKLIF